VAVVVHGDGEETERGKETAMKRCGPQGRWPTRAGLRCLGQRENREKRGRGWAGGERVAQVRGVRLGFSVLFLF
jgi:hypothetical protein